MLPTQATLKGNTARLRQLIKEHGSLWVIHSHDPEPMQCFNGELGVQICSFEGSHLRNVRLTDLDISLFDIEINP